MCETCTLVGITGTSSSDKEKRTSFAYSFTESYAEFTKVAKKIIKSSKTQKYIGGNSK